jgi:F-type H+-transporting ATPase subunit delta
VTGRLAKRYARALFELAREEGRVEAAGDELGRAMAAFDDPRLRLLVLNPAIDAGARLQTAKSVAAALSVSRTLANLIAILAERNRLVILPDIVRWYDIYLDAELGRARITIRSATPLGGSEKNELVELARRLTGRREIVASTEVDAELLAGVVLDVGGTVYDGSARAQLARLTKDMGEGGA